MTDLFIIFVFVLVCFETRYYSESWMAWNSPCRLGCPCSLCLPSAGFEGVHHHAQLICIVVNGRISFPFSKSEYFIMCLHITIVCVYARIHSCKCLYIAQHVDVRRHLCFEAVPCFTCVQASSWLNFKRFFHLHFLSFHRSTGVMNSCDSDSDPHI